MHIQAHGIERTARVDPVGRSDDPFIAESKNLATGDEVAPPFRGTAYLNIGLADIPNILIRQCIWNVLIEKDARVLRLAEESEPFHGLNSHIKPDPAQQICIVRGCVLYAILAFDASSVFAAELNPARQSV